MYTKFEDFVNEAKITKTKVTKTTDIGDYWTVYADWRDTESLIEQFSKVLKSNGLHVMEDPTTEDSDQFGFIISKKKISKKEAKELTEPIY